MGQVAPAAPVGSNGNVNPGNRWTNLSSRPAGRGDAAMAYDSAAKRIILFGGLVGTRDSDETWAYDVRSNTWTNMSPANHPAGREAVSMAFDSAAGVTILYGGDGAGPAGTRETWAYDARANTWTNLNPTFPSAQGRTLHALAYDASVDRVIMFGGFPYAVGTWAYDYRNNTWTNRSPSSSPPSAEALAMAYDAAAGRTILFGGFTSTPTFTTWDQTWAYDYRSNTWTNRNPSIHPSKRAYHSMVYDSAADRTIASGGTGNGGLTLLGETWAYDYGSNRWTNMTRAGHPSPRDSMTMAYDAAAGWTILFGGYPITGTYPSDETWAYHFATNAWTNHSLRPAGREQHAMAYDARLDRAVLFGGYGAGGNLAVYENDTWVFDPATNLWANMSPANPPVGRFGHGMVYDSAADRVVLFGGFGFLIAGGFSDETWIYDLTNNTWTQKFQATKPVGRYSLGLSYDSRQDRIVMFGGWYASTLCSQETWVYDYWNNTWTDKSSAIYPRPQCDFAMTYDTAAGRSTLFGGRPFDGGPLLNETWSYDLALNTWKNETPAIPQSPSGRVFSAMAYDSVAGRSILLGGVTKVAMSEETWAYDSTAHRWTNLNPGLRPSGRDFPAAAFASRSARTILFGGLTSVFDDEGWAYDSRANAWTRQGPPVRPPARSLHSMAYDASAARTILFGGFGGPGLNATWSYDSLNNTWTNMSPANHPQEGVGASMAYDESAGRVILFGGFDETWVYDLRANTWTSRHPAKHPTVGYAAMAYDTAAGRTILFGGFGGGRRNDDTWAYDYAANTWTNMSPAIHPAARSQHAMAYDKAAQRLVLFGGGQDDTWTYDARSNVWTNMSPTNHPTVFSVAMAYDPLAGRTILYGFSSASGVNDTWAYDAFANTWTNLRPAVHPPGRNTHAMAYDVAAGRAILFGGQSAAGVDLLGDSWVYEDAPNHPSPPRSLQAIAGDSVVTLTWLPPAAEGGPNVTGFVVYRGTAAGSESKLTSLGRVQSFTDSGLANGVTYYYKVSAVNTVGEGPMSTEVSAAPAFGLGGPLSGAAGLWFWGLLVAVAVVGAVLALVWYSRRKRRGPPEPETKS